MANEQIIDQVIAPVSDTQVTNLTKLLVDLDIQMATNIKSANALNAATGNSKSFKEYQTNAAAAALATEKIQQAQNKTTETALKLNEVQSRIAAAEAARQAKALADQQKRDAAQAISDAKQIAAAEAKAAKLAEIERKKNVQFPNEVRDPNNPYNLRNPDVTQEPKPVVTREDTSPVTTKNTEAIAAENAELLEQQKALDILSVEQKQNIELLLQLQAERAANAVELKGLNTETAIGAERSVFLTAEQFRLKTEIAGVTLELNRQTKQMIAAQGSVTELDQSILLLSSAYESLSVSERESEQGQKMGAELAALRTQQNELGLAVKNTKNNIGNYTESINKSSAGTALADRVSNQFTRSIIRMGVQFLLLGVIFKAVEWIYQYVAALNIFNPVATETERRQNALVEAFKSSDYQKGIENVTTLTAELDLASKGMLDSDKAVNTYNETIGKTYGYVNNLNDAQAEFIKNKDAYVKAVLDEAAANAIAADAGKEIADLAAKNQQLRNFNEANKDVQKTSTDKTFGNLTAQQIRENLIEIEDNKKRIDQIIKNTTGALEDVIGGNSDLQKQKSGADAVAELMNKIANDQLEREKIIAQSKIGNEKLSYATRLQAIEDFYKASKQIDDNNTALQLRELPAKDARREQVQKDSDNKLLELQISTDVQRRALQDKAYKQDQEILKNNLEKQRDLFKAILDDPNQSYSAKIIALDVYNKKSLELIKANYDEQIKEAGKNGKSIKLAEQEKAKGILQLENETSDKRLKIQKETLQKLIEQSKESEQDQVEAIDNGSKIALRALSKVKDDKENELSLQRAQGKITEKKYNDELLAINDAYNIQRIQQEITAQQAILAIKEGRRDADLSLAKIAGASPEQLAKIASDANKGIQPTKDKIADLGIDLGNALSKQTIDQTKSGASDKDKARQSEIFAIQQTTKAVDELDNIRQKAYENEISRLEKLAQQVEDNATAEKDAVNNSIASSATKAREIATIDAQAKRQKDAIQAQENKIKQKEAIADKEAAIAKIILETAIAAIKAPAELGPILGLAAVPVVLALGAVELALAAATQIPQFAQGTDNYPGGLGIWGEAGMERATLPDGTVQYSNGAALANFPKGTKITPHMELMQQIKPDASQYAGGEQIGWKQLLAQMKKLEPKKQRNLTVVHINTEYESYKRKYLGR